MDQRSLWCNYLSICIILIEDYKDYEHCYFLDTEINGSCGGEHSRAAKDASQFRVFKFRSRWRNDMFIVPCYDLKKWKVSTSLEAKDSENPWGEVHKKCQTQLCTKLASHKKMLPLNRLIYKKMHIIWRRDYLHNEVRENIFCVEKTVKDSTSYDDGGLGSCEQLNSMSRLLGE